MQKGKIKDKTMEAYYRYTYLLQNSDSRSQNNKTAKI